VPLLPACLTEPLWVEFAALIGSSERSEFSPARPWGCHRRRIGDRVVFDHVLAALVHGSGYERIAAPGCSDRTIRRRLVEWAEAGVGQALLRIGRRWCSALRGCFEAGVLEFQDLQGLLETGEVGAVAGEQRQPVPSGGGGDLQVHPAWAGLRPASRTAVASAPWYSATSASKGSTS
jgi:hypothetical protein